MRDLSNLIFITYDEFGKSDNTRPKMKDNFAPGRYKYQDIIKHYLERGENVYACTNVLHDVFTGESVPYESGCSTDGVYCWNMVLPYYIDKYNLRLPKDFERHILEQEKKRGLKIELSDLD